MNYVEINTKSFQSDVAKTLRWGLCVVLCIYIFLIGCDKHSKKNDQESFQTKQRVPIEIIKVIDGDTLYARVQGQGQRVRLRCIDTPSISRDAQDKNVPIGEHIRVWVENYLQGQTCELELEAGHERDPFQRQLGTLWILHDLARDDDDENFNLTLVRLGFSPYKTKWGRSAEYDSEFREAEQQARKEKRGLWRK